MFKHNITVVDRTVQQRKPIEIRQVDENILIVGSFPEGRSNRLLQYYPGEYERFTDEFGLPNYFKTGIGPYIAVEALKNDRNMGVAVVNLKPDDATISNCTLLAKVKVNKNVQMTNDLGQTLYVTPGGEIVTEQGSNTPYTRDVMLLKLETGTIASVTNHSSFASKLDALRDTETSNHDGFEVYPLAVFYATGEGSYGNKMHLRLLPKVSAYNDAALVDIDYFNGRTNEEITNAALNVDIEGFAGEEAFIESVVMRGSDRLGVQVSKYMDELFEKMGEYVGTDFLTRINIFDLKYPTLKTESGSVDPTAFKAFELKSGKDGTSSQVAQKFKDFFDGKVIEDIDNITRYKIDIIPDLEYTTEVKQAIAGFCKRRVKTTNAILMVGTNTFESAVSERQTSFLSDMDSVMLMAACQKPFVYDPWTKRNLQLPSIFFTMIAYINMYALYGHTYNAMAGASVRWEGFQEDTLMNPPYNDKYLEKLEESRINYVRMDNMPGAYIASQNTNTQKITDRMEFNNMRITSQIVYMINQIVHQNGYRFNDSEDISRFDDKVKMEIGVPFARFVSNIHTRVYKKTNLGADKNVNYIDVFINFKDLSKQTNTTIVISDEDFKPQEA